MNKNTTEEISFKETEELKSSRLALLSSTIENETKGKGNRDDSFNEIMTETK